MNEEEKLWEEVLKKQKIYTDADKELKNKRKKFFNERISSEKEVEVLIIEWEIVNRVGNSKKFRQ